MSIDKYKSIEPSVLLGLAKRLGLEHVEITKTVFEELAQVKKQIDGLTSGFHLPIIEMDGFDLSCTEHQVNIDETISKINANWQDLNIGYCVAHPPEPDAIDSDIKTSEHLLLENLDRLEPPLVLENVPTWRKQRFDEFCQKAKQALGDKLKGLCFDAAHCYLSGEDIESRFKELYPQVTCIHLSDCGPTEDLHLPFDSGGILPISEFLSMLQQMKYQDTITLELKPHSLDDLQQVLKSYLKVLKHLDKWKYWKTKARLLFITPRILVEKHKVA